MTRRICWFLVAASISFVAGCGSMNGSTPVVADRIPSAMPFPPKDSRELVIPDKLWEYIGSQTGFVGRTIGYTPEEMKRMKFSKHILPLVERLFTDVKDVPDVSTYVGDTFLSMESSPKDIMLTCYSLLNHKLGRGIAEPKDDEWALEDLDNSLPAAKALDFFIPGEGPGLTDAERASWESLPAEAQKLVIRLLAASADSSLYLKEVLDGEFLRKHAGNRRGDLTPDMLYKFASTPWMGLNPSKASFDALDDIDIDYLGFGTVLYMIHAQKAAKEYKAALKGQATVLPEGFKGLRVRTAYGTLRIYGVGADVISDEDDIIIDLGGSDRYTGRKAVPLSIDNPASIVFDAEGDDEYYSEMGAGLACGLFGVGGLIDLAGDDSYRCKESGIASAWYGTGFVWDLEGDDRYEVEGADGEGSAHAGVGILMDNDGNDTYLCGTEAQGFGSTLGIGALVDFRGDDSYRASDTFRLSAPFNNKPISFAQGTGFGRRADYTDGHNLAGGIGILVEGDGNDDYYGNIYCQGAGYWWAMGICVDRGGDDTYHCIWYSLGSAPHSAIGCMIDLKGDDKYNVGNDDAVLQHMACARDSSVAVFIDAEGDDTYDMRYRCAGSADLDSIALFWDILGNDTYYTTLDRKDKDEPPFGSAVVYPKSERPFVDKITAGIFLDTQGMDRYFVDEKALGRLPKAKDGSIWRESAGPFEYGIGVDMELFK